MHEMKNPWRGPGIPAADLSDAPRPSVDVDRPRALLARCPDAGETPLVEASALAADAGVARLWVKDERPRMGLGSFKALGAAYVIARAAEEGRLAPAYVTASAGNHGLSVAAGARVFGARAVVYLSVNVPESFAERLRAEGADVRRAGEDYEASMVAAKTAAEAEDMTLLSDTSWAGYFEIPHTLMEGYLVMAAEAVEAVNATGDVPTHVMLQAGVGGLAGAVAAYVRHAWGDGPQIWVVEPDAAPCVSESLRAGQSLVTPGPVSDMGRLDCKEPSLIALAGLSADADGCVTLTEDEGAAVLPRLAAMGLDSSPSGAAGIAALFAGLNLGPDARVLTFLSEGPA